MFIIKLYIYSFINYAINKHNNKLLILYDNNNIKINNYIKFYPTFIPNNINNNNNFIDGYDYTYNENNNNNNNTTLNKIVKNYINNKIINTLKSNKNKNIQDKIKIINNIHDGYDINYNKYKSNITKGLLDDFNFDL